MIILVEFGTQQWWSFVTLKSCKTHTYKMLHRL